jgi:hypothetical protein
MIALTFTRTEWAAFGMGAGVVILLFLIAAGLLFWHWGRTIPPEFREKPPGPPEHQNCRCVPRPELTPDERDRMTHGRFENTPDPKRDTLGLILARMFIFVPTEGPAANTRRLIDGAEAQAMALGVYKEPATVIRMLSNLQRGECACVSVAGGMLERPRKLGEVPHPTPGRDNVSPLRNHPELAEDPQYIRQCLRSRDMAEDYAARTGRRPELFGLRSAAGSGILLTRKRAVEFAAKHYPPSGAEDIIASLARGACSRVDVGSGTITRFELTAS